MKKITILLGVILLAYVSTIAQFGNVKDRDTFTFEEIQKKTLYIHIFDPDSKYAKKLIKKGKFDELKSLEEMVAYYNEVWAEAMATSAWDATPYEIREFSASKLFAEKNEDALVLTYKFIYPYNVIAEVRMTGPVEKLLASAFVNGLDLGKAGDIRLMMNMLNNSLNVGIELSEEEKEMVYSNTRNKYKEVLVAFEENLENMLFLVPKFTEEEFKNYKKRNSKIEKGIVEWTASKYEIVPTEEIDERRANGDTECFFWRSFTVWSSMNGIPVPIYSVNMFFTCERDEFLYYWYGGKMLKKSSILSAQEEIKRKAGVFKVDLEKVKEREEAEKVNEDE